MAGWKATSESRIFSENQAQAGIGNQRPIAFVIPLANLPLYNPCVLKFLRVSVWLWAGSILAQQASKPSDQPQVKLNYLNVCTPSAEEQAVLKSALSQVSGNPAFAEDFEISRGRATLKDAPSSRFVRLRRDFASQSSLMTVQYSMSTDSQSTIETLVLRMRDPREFHELSIEDRVSANAASPMSVVATDTPAARIRVERLGKSSVVLARCDGADQSVYELLFKQASDLTARYRGALGLRTAFRPDIAWLGRKSENPAGRHKQP
jgi:hypothetical protein